MNRELEVKWHIGRRDKTKILSDCVIQTWVLFSPVIQIEGWRHEVSVPECGPLQKRGYICL